jgi:hypothetical protein
MLMITQTEIVQPRKARSKWFLVASCAAVLFLVVGCITVFLVLRGGGGEPATAYAAERVTRDFVQALHNGDLQAAHQMFSEKIRSETSKDDITRVLEANENRAIFGTYQSLEVCDWGLFTTSGSVPLSGPKVFCVYRSMIYHKRLGGTRKLSNSSIVQM